MKTNNAILMLAIMLLSSLSMGQVVLPEAALTLRVLDESGNPVVDADAGIGNNVFGKGSKRGKTDAAGEFSAQHRTTGSLLFGVRKSGFYNESGEYLFKANQVPKDPSLWEQSRLTPWNPTVVVKLKRVGEFLPVYARRLNLCSEIPVSDEALGFDFVEGSWIAPYGSGKVVDILVTGRGTLKDNSFRVEFAFPNAQDGIVVVPKGATRSRLISPKVAPMSDYLPNLTVDKNWQPVRPDGSIEEMPSCFVFRVRTVVDENGAIKAANYGKMYLERLKIVYFFNPTPNSRGLEFDLGKNLSRNLPAAQALPGP